MNFQTTTELVDFLTAVSPGIQNANIGAELSLIRLLALKNSLKFATPENQNKTAFKDWLKSQEPNIVFSEPAGEWFVRSELLWDLHKKFQKTQFAEQIAWTAAQNPLPGECEGYVNCYLYYFRSTYGEYLSSYPDGKNSVEALKAIGDSLTPIVSDLAEKTVYNGPTDISDRADFNKYLSELRTIVSKMQSTDKEKILQQLNQIGEGYR